MPQRQIKLGPQVAARGVGLPGAVSVPAADVDESGARLARGMEDFARTAGNALGRAYVAEETGRVDEAVLAAERRMDEWRSRYQEEKRGALAANAGAEYAAAWEAIAKETEKEFGGAGVFPDMLRRRLAERGAQAAGAGLAYQARQHELWQASQWESQLDGFQRFAAANPFGPEVEREAQALKASYALKHPGLDPGRVFNEIDGLKAASQLDALLAGGKAAEAEALLGSLEARTGRKADIQGMDPDVERLIRAAGARQGFDAQGIEILLATAMQESGGRQNVVSRAGALGVMQLMPATAKELGVDPRDVAQNIEGGARYLKRMHERYGGDWEAALAAYNMGPGAYDQFRRGQREMPGETRRYAPGVLGRLRAGGVAGLSPARLGQFRSRIAAARRQEQARLAASMRQDIESYIAASEDGNIVEAPYAEAQVRAAFGEEAENVLARMRQAGQLAQDLDQAGRLGLAEQNELVASRRPAPDSPAYRQEAAAFGLLAGKVAALQKEMLADPAGFVTARDEGASRARTNFFQRLATPDAPAAAREYAAAVRGACAARGLPPRLFGKADGEMLGAMLTRAEDPQQALEAFAKAMGPDYAQAVREIGGSLAPAMRLVAAGLPREAGRLILAAERDRDWNAKVEKLLGLAGADRTEFYASVHNRLEDLHTSFLGGGDTETPAAIESAVGKLALQHMGRLGLNQSQAIERACAEVLGSRYELVRSNGRRPAARIPSGEDVERVAGGMAAWLENPPLAELSLAMNPLLDQDLTKDAFRSMLKREAYWLTDRDEAGAVLFLGGCAVYGRDGSPVRLSWRQLADLGLDSECRQQELERLRAEEAQPELISLNQK